MSTFWKRLRFFGIGVAIGLVLVYFMFGKRDIRCSYFPNSRVLNDLRQKELVFSPTALCQKECLALDSLDIKQLFAAGSIQFDESEPRKEPCGEYELITRLPDMREIHYRVQNCDSTVTMIYLKHEETSCACD